MTQFVSRKDAKTRKDAKANDALHLCVSLRETNSLNFNLCY